MITTIVLGAGAGIGLWAFVTWLFPPRPSLRVALAHAISPATDTAEVERVRIVAPAVRLLCGLGLPGARMERNLAVIGRSASVHLTEKIGLAIAGLLSPALPTIGLAVAGLPPGFEAPLIAGLALAAVGFLVPDLKARAAAERMRAGFRHALTAYLDLVWITLAGGAGIDSALSDSARTGAGWAFDRIRRALETARLTRATPWAALRRLGEELDITELIELAASADLAGVEGAKVRASLAAKARAMRTRQVIEAEADAQAATERMSLPVMALFLGFLGFIAYPALIQVLNGL